MAELKNHFFYDPITGLFKKTSGPANGAMCLSVETGGYIRLRLNNRAYVAHRVAWFFVYGVVPSNYIDHINGNKKDNRIANLRECTNQQNTHNSATRVDNKTGFKGVSWCSKNGKFRAQIQLLSKRRISLGFFEAPELAAAAYQVKAKQIHGEFYKDTIPGNYRDIVRAAIEAAEGARL